MKTLLYYLIIVGIFASCTSSNSELLQIHDNQLNSLLDSNINELRTLVDNTGNTLLGIQFLDHAIKMQEELSNLSTLTNDLDELKADARTFLDFVNNNPDSISFNIEPISTIISEVTEGDAALISLKFFAANAIKGFIDRYNSYTRCYDMVYPYISNKQLEFRAGERYETDIFLKPMNSGLTKRIEVDFVDDEKGYFEIPVENGAGNLVITKLKKGQTKINYRITEFNHGQVLTNEGTIELIAK